MSQEPINTRTNICLNGHFETSAHWNFGNPPARKLGQWEGQSIYYCSLWKGTSLRQQVCAPATQATGAQYTLSFLYGNRGDAAGTFSLRRIDTEDCLEISLPPTGSRVGDSEPLALELTRCTSLVQFDVDQGDQFEFEIKSDTTATQSTDLIIARIDFHLELEPLELTHIVNDGEVHAVNGNPTLYLCHGATGDRSHPISFELAADSPWAGTEVLLWSLDNPEEMVVLDPDWDETQSIDEVWLADCPTPTSNDTLQFNLSIYSKYHADRYEIAVSLGHHRLLVESAREPAHQPVIEHDQSVTIGVYVKSYYLGGAMQNHPVSWMLGEEELGISQTNAAGYAEFVFAPTIGGTHEIEARVDSLFHAGGHAAHAFTVRAHDEDPLKAVLVKFPDRDTPLPWGKEPGRPERGATYEIEVIFPHDSPLLGGDVWLEYDGSDPALMGVTVSPDFKHEVPIETSLFWTLVSAEGKNEEFQLRLVSADLEEPSVRNHMLLARHGLELQIGDVREANRVPVVDEQDYVWCMLQVVDRSEEPLADVPVEWETSVGIQRTYTGASGWASVVDRPTTDGDYTLVARVNPKEGESALEQEFAIETLPTSAWSTASFMLDEVAVERVGAGVVCRMGQTYQLHLKVEADSSLIGKEVSLRWQDLASAESIVIADMEIPIPITEAGAQWSVEASVAETSGVFDLHVISDDMEALDLAFRLLPDDLSAEVQLFFDQVPQNWDADVTLYPCIGTTHDLTVVPLNNLGGLHGLLLETTVEPSLPSDWIINPPLSEPAAMTAGGVRFHCDFTSASIAAQHRWTINLLGVGELAQPSALEMNLGHNLVRLDTPYEVAFDPVLSNDESARLALRYVSGFTGKPASGVSVVWDDGESSLSAADGIAQHNYQPSSGGDHEVEALVRNPYDGSEIKHTFNVYAHEEDPWLDLKVRSFSKSERPWGDQTFFPRLPDRTELTLSVPEGSPLLDQRLVLGMSGAHELETGLMFEPVGLGIERSWDDKDELSVFLSSGQTDAAFYLQLSASRLLARSPLNAFSLGSQEPTEVLASSSQEGKVADWGETLSFEVTLISALTGQPARRVPVSWEGTDETMESAATTTNFYGVARISFIATAAGSGSVTARSAGGSEVVTFDYYVNEPCVIESLTSDRLEGEPGEEITAEAVVVSATTGELVEGVRVHWFFKGVVLEPVVTDAQGKAQITFVIPPRSGDCTLSASVRGEFGWESASLVITVNSENFWPRHFNLLVGGHFVEWPHAHLTLSAPVEITIELEYGDSFLAGAPDAQVCLKYVRGSESENLVFDPPLGELLVMERGSSPLRWTVSTNTVRDYSFALQFLMPLFREISPSPPISGSVLSKI
ncbi:Ig-like domain-containing protein [Pseudomonas sp. R4-84]